MLNGELSEEFTGRMAVIPHESIPGVRCRGCISAAADGNDVELHCEECGTVVGVLHVEIFKSLVGLGYARTACSHCGREHVFEGTLADLKPFVCYDCGLAVHPTTAASDLDPDQWVVRTLRRPPEEK
jgi:hypothetical protein